MNWRNFKTDSEGFKGSKGFKPPEPPPIKPLKPLKPTEGILKNDDPAPPDLFTLIGETLAEIDRRGRHWTSWRKSLTQEQRQRLKALEREIDRAALAEDRRRLESALEAYRKFTLSRPDQAGRTDG